MVTMTYGIVPTWTQFAHTYEAEIGSGIYTIRLGQTDAREVGDVVSEGNYNVEELYALVTELVKVSEETGRDAHAAFACYILYSLGFGWV